MAACTVHCITMKKKYLKASVISNKLEIRESKIHGQGIFAKSRIEKDEVIVIWGGTVFTKNEIESGKGKRHTLVGISEDLYLGSPETDELSMDDYMNHSCNPNVGMQDEVTLVAKRAIDPDEELTADYAIWLNNEDYVMNRSCNCGDENCRHRITGTDWKLKSVQDENRGYFSPFIEARADKLK